jgi:hypothetical protein
VAHTGANNEEEGSFGNSPICTRREPYFEDYRDLVYKKKQPNVDCS